MDFFERQRQAKKKTGVLVFLFCVAVLLISLLNFLIIAAVIPFLGEDRKREGFDFSTLQDPSLAALVVLGTFVVIFLAGLYRKSQLSGGGSSIASMKGGRLVNMASTDPDEQKLMNVVEEMAIASSVPMPEVFVMSEEKAINAFAAGYTVDDAVIGVTDGCMRRLSRDELQGVIAHEFSHILNQDMRLNFRLIAVVFGLLVLAQLGRLMMRIGFNSSGRRSSRSRNEGGGAALIIGVAGLGIMASGGLGILMGNLIKSAVSRQREYLADSSAVQYTRNPGGLAGALKKIGAMATGSRLLTPHAEEASHMFFGNGMRESWFSFAATHPPLLNRILLLEPSFDGDFSGVKFEERRSSAAKPDSKARRTQAGIPIPGVGDALGQAGINGAKIQYQSGGDSKERLQVTVSDGDGDNAIGVLAKAFATDEGFKKVSQLHTGESISGEILQGATKSLLIALFAILVYVTFRYEFSFALGAILAICHDVLMTLGLFFQWGGELSAPVMAAVLTIIGFSINDTIVIFDRIREDLKLNVKGSFTEIMNGAISKTLSRTIITSGTTLLAAGSLFLLGGGAIHSFAFVLLAGVVTGTFSSIFIAGYLVLWKNKGKKPSLADETVITQHSISTSEA